MHYLANTQDMNLYVMMSGLLLCIISFRALTYLMSLLKDVGVLVGENIEVNNLITVTAFNLVQAVVLVLARDSIDKTSSMLILAITFVQFVWFNTCIFRKNKVSEIKEI